MAEYAALLKGLCLVKGKKEKICVYTDSLLLCNQINGAWKVNNEQLLKIFERCFFLIKKIKHFSIEHIPREKNIIADSLASKAIFLKKDGNNNI